MMLPSPTNIHEEWNNFHERQYYLNLYLRAGFPAGGVNFFTLALRDVKRSTVPRKPTTCHVNNHHRPSISLLSPFSLKISFINPYFTSIMINPAEEAPDIPDLAHLSLRSPLVQSSIPSPQVPFIPVDEWLNETTIAAAYQRMSLISAS